MSLLRLSQVSLHYGPTTADAPLPVLQGVSLDLRRGDFVSVIGRSGSGKTSLLNLAAGFLAPTLGRVEIDGRPVTGPGAERAVVFQDDALFPWWRVEDNVALALKLAGVPREVRLARARHWLAAVGLEGQGGKRVWQLSGGQRQRVGIARALAAEPDLLICDEVTSALDPLIAEDILNLLRRLQDELGVTYLFITHDLSVVRRLAERTVVMRKGRIVEDRPTADLFAAPQDSYTRTLIESVPELRQDWLNDIMARRAR